MLTAIGSLLLSSVTVTLPDEVHVKGSEMTLGEVAVVEGESETQVELVKQFSLGYAPSPGYSRVLRSWQLEQRLRREYGNLDLVFDGEAACRVWPTVATVTGAELEKVASENLAALFEGQDVEIGLRAPLDDEPVPAGLQSRELIAEPTTTKLTPGVWNVPVRIVIDGVPYRTVWASFQVDLYRVMPVLETDIAPGETIEARDVVLRRAPVDAGQTPLEKVALIGAEAKRLLVAGRPVAERDVRRELAIKRGETVSLAVRNGLVTIATEVVAMRDAYLGDLVPIQTFGSNRELTAKVVGKNKLELRLDRKN